MGIEAITGDADPPTLDGCLVLTVDQVGKLLGIGRNQAYEAVRAGEIPSIRLGKRILVPTEAFKAMLAIKSKQEIVAAELVRRLQHADSSS